MAATKQQLAALKKARAAKAAKAARKKTTTKRTTRTTRKHNSAGLGTIDNATRALKQALSRVIRAREDIESGKMSVFDAKWVLSEAESDLHRAQMELL